MRPLIGPAAVAIVSVSVQAHAVPGPDSVAVIANADVPESVALARRYARARQLPDRQICALPLPQVVTVPLDRFRSDLLEPLEACLDDAGVLSRIEALLVVRGVPLRVELPGGAGRVSIAAALGVWQSTLQDGTPLLGQPPGRNTTCAGGQPCTVATWTNPFRDGVFSPGWTREASGVVWRPMLVTMLHGRSFEDAAKLVASATTAEARGGVAGELMLMAGADPARGALDGTFPAVERELRERGYDVARVPFDTNLTGRTLGALMIGTASLGATIEGNTYAPGSLVDNLTSYGAVPENFEAMGEAQVSIARWVARGVAGVHGTTDEPLANSFPDRRLLVDYVDGMTLAEAYLRRMPFVYWQNLVLGDPMAAPHARRPRVAIEDLGGSGGARKVRARADDPEGRGIAWLAIFVDGVEQARADAGEVELCAQLPAGADVQVLAVAQIAGSGSVVDGYTPKGWRELRVPSPGGAGACDVVPDAGVATPGPDSGAAPHDAGSAAPGDDPPGPGCACSAAERSGGTAVPFMLLAAAAALGLLLRRPLGAWCFSRSPRSRSGSRSRSRSGTVSLAAAGDERHQSRGSQPRLLVLLQSPRPRADGTGAWR